jgi:exodeoxyribonuclease-5
MSFTDDQLKCINELNEFLDSNLHEFLIIGNAGVGKTYLISEYFKKIKGCEIYFTAPTNKAVKVLASNFSKKEQELFNFKTIASILNVRETIRETGIIDYLQIKISDIKNSIIVIDEASMISDYIYKKIQNDLVRNNKIIYLGDDKQLPPINEELSVIFKEKIPTFQLTEIIRQEKNNPILILSREESIKDSILKKSILQGKELDIGFEYTILSKTKSIIEKHGIDNLQFIAWTNKIVDDLNNSIRCLIHKIDKPAKILIDDRLVVNNLYRDYTVNDEIVVKSIELRDVEIKEFGNIICKAYYINNNILVIHEESEQEFNSKLDKLRGECINQSNKRLWTMYYEIKKKYFLDFKYAFCITSHKSQGSTYQNVVILTFDMFQNKKKNELQKMLYTTITRAKKKVYLMSYLDI